MLERSDFIHPTFNYQHRIQKPPLTYWCIALSFWILGIREFAARLPSAIAACLFLGFLIYFLHRSSLLTDELGPAADESWHCPQASSWPAAFMAAAILATTPRFFVVTRRLPIDCLLTVFVSIALLLVYQALERPPQRAQARSVGFLHRAVLNCWEWLAAGVFTGLAFLTKGPVALVLVLITTGLYAWIARKRTRLRGPMLFLAAFLVTAVPYYWILFTRGGATILYRILIEENFGRYTILDFGPLRGDFYYLQVLLVDALPWSWFLPAAIYLWRSWRPKNCSLLCFCWVWFFTVFAFFSFSRNKQEYYILPAYVALSILLAHFLSQQTRGHSHLRILALRATALGLAAGLITVSVIVVLLARFFPLPPIAYLTVFLLLASGVITARLLWQGWLQRATQLLATLLLLVWISVCFLVLPSLETLRPIRRLATQIGQTWQPEDRAGYFRFSSPSMSFYLRTHIFELSRTDDLEEELDRPGKSFILLQAEEFDRLPFQISARLEVIGSADHFPTRGKEILKLSPTSRLPKVLLARERDWKISH